MNVVLLGKSFVFFLFGSVLLLFCGCSSAKVWTYQPESPIAAVPVLNKTVVVLPMHDTRIDSNDESTDMYYIPLMPYGWQDFPMPEKSPRHLTTGGWRFKPSEDFAKALAAELQNAKVFKDVVYASGPSEGGLALRGIIKSTEYRSKLFSYGLSIVGPDLWFIGFPSGRVANQLELHFQLEDPSTNKILWQGDYAQEKSRLSWIYNLRNDFFYDELLKNILKDAIPAMRKSLSEN